LSILVLDAAESFAYIPSCQDDDEGDAADGG
jgi:hypothetical protein